MLNLIKIGGTSYRREIRGESVEILRRIAFVAGYEAGTEDAGSGELLAEAEALQKAFYNLDGKTGRAFALDESVMAVGLETMKHVEDCRCGLCTALEVARAG